VQGSPERPGKVSVEHGSRVPGKASWVRVRIVTDA
jgi:hypothetical protein